MSEDEEGYINSVTIGGKNAWYMMGHTFWSDEFSANFLAILKKEYDLPETENKLWEEIFMAHLDVLKMKIRKYAPGVIYEFDTLDELREFDESYRVNTQSSILKKVSKKLGVTEDKIINITSIKGETTEADGFEFDCNGVHYEFKYSTLIGG